MSTSSPTQSAMYHRVEFWKTVAWAGLLLAGALFMVDPRELLSSSVLPRAAAERLPVSIDISDVAFC